MKIETKLDDPKLCNGCPCLTVSGNTLWRICGSGFDLGLVKNEAERPKRCIEIHGE